MNEVLLNILSVIVTAVIIPMITLGGSLFIKWLSTKIKNDTTRELLSSATTVVLNAVKSVFQTYVDSLKKNGTFDKDAQVVAFCKAKEIALFQLSEEVKDFIRTTYGDVDEWLRIQIEATIESLKNK